MPGDFFRTIKDVCNRLSILSNWNFPTLLAFKMTVTVSSVSNLADLLQLIESNEPEQWQEIKNLIYEQYVRLVHKNVFFYSLFSSCQFLSGFEWILNRGVLFKKTFDILAEIINEHQLFYILSLNHLYSHCWSKRLSYFWWNIATFLTNNI